MDLNTRPTKKFQKIFGIQGGQDDKKLLEILLEENPFLGDIIDASTNEDLFIQNLHTYFHNKVKKQSPLNQFVNSSEDNKSLRLKQLKWQDFALLRLYEYVEHDGLELEDLNLRGENVTNQPFRLIWRAFHSREELSSDFYMDMIMLFRQYSGNYKRKHPDKNSLIQWMSTHPSGLEKNMVQARKTNKKRIIRSLIKHLDQGKFISTRYHFEEGLTIEEKINKMNNWWNESHFHLKFAIREPEMLNEMLDYSLDKNTMNILFDAKEKGIPFFVNPYYLSLLIPDSNSNTGHADLAIRTYILYSQELVDEFGHIVAWEKEDKVKPGKPNAAGWLLPNDNNIHRRYPEVSILIPDTMGRACAGLCSSCQRMYDFQSGRLNFNLDKLKPKLTWNEKLHRLLEYWENDSQLRDILITGGDALMSSDKTLEKILTAVYEMAKRKKEANDKRENGNKYAQLLRVRLGSRLPVYLPQRVTDNLVRILAEFREKAAGLGIKQFVIQTHFISAMEITPETKAAIGKLSKAGWIITNQQVFTSSGARRGHTAKLRKTLNDIGIIPYYSFSVKGYRENSFQFATNARMAQEICEEKVFGYVPPAYHDEIRQFPEDAWNITDKTKSLREKLNLPFLATDRSVLNMPGVGKSLTFRVIGILADGRRILSFDHDSTRNHSPIIHEMEKVMIVESKSILDLLNQMDSFGEDVKEYQSIWGYSAGQTENRHPIFEYPELDYGLTEEFTNLGI